MDLNPEVCYRAVQARDARYDGRFFTCVKSTGIYCRPICPARPPKLENCRFVPTAAAAQEADYRPCLRCRPESSPEYDAWRGTEATVSRALKMIEGGALDGGDVGELAERLGIGERQLRRLFGQHIGAAPITVAQTRRVLLAKQLLHQTNLSMIDVALASGFGSVRRFNETFQRLYQRAPSELRQKKAAEASRPESSSPEIKLLLPYRPPYDWTSMLHFFRMRAIADVEAVTEESYSRVIELDAVVGSIHVTNAPQQSSLAVTIRFPQLSALPAIIARVRRQFDLGADPAAIATTLSDDLVLAPLVARRPGLRVPGCFDGFEAAVRAILGQQITLQGGVTMTARLAARLGSDVADQIGVTGLTRTFPRPQQVTRSQLNGLGLTTARAKCLADVAEVAVKDSCLFEPRRDLSESVAQLKTLAGIGEWTAQYIALRAMGESDAFLAGDVALQRKFVEAGQRATAQQLLARAEAWRPWRAYATIHLWMAD